MLKETAKQIVFLNVLELSTWRWKLNSKPFSGFVKYAFYTVNTIKKWDW